MARKIFMSFHYELDNWRVSQIKNMGKIEGNSILTPNSWEEITNQGDSKIKEWIANNMKGRSCLVVLIGEKTSERKWVKYEIKKAWEDGLGVVGIYIHKLKDKDKCQSSMGKNPFEAFSLKDEAQTPLSKIVECHNPPGSSSKDAYDFIRDNISDWIEDAILARNKYK